MIVYKYGARLMDHERDVEDQLWRAHRYYNLLVEMARARFGAVSNTLDEHSVDERATALSLPPDAPHADKDAAWKMVREARKRAAAGPAKSVLMTINERYRDIIRRARAVCGVYWGTYLQVEKAAEQASRSPRPSFRRWDRSGLIAVQLQNGASVTELLGEDTRVRLAVSDKKYGGGAGRCLADALLRIGSEGREPIFARFQIRYHRPIAEGAVVKWVVAKRVPVGPLVRWTVQFVCETPADRGLDRASTGSRDRAGLDVGWRRLPDGGVRLAYLVDSAGRQEEVRLDPRVETLYTRAAGLDGEADDLQNALRADHPEIAWPRKRERLLSLVARLKTEGTAPAAALMWRSAVRQAAEHRRRAQHIRQEQFRQLAATWTRRYEVIAVEDDSGLTTFGEKRDGEAPSRHHERILQRWAAPGELVSTLRQATHGCIVLDAPAADTTLRCCQCGHVNDWKDDERRQLMLTCQSCGVATDQDEQAGTNLLASASAHVLDPDAGNGSAGLSARQERMRDGARKRRINSAPAKANQDAP